MRDKQRAAIFEATERKKKKNKQESSDCAVCSQKTQGLTAVPTCQHLKSGVFHERFGVLQNMDTTTDERSVFKAKEGITLGSGRNNEVLR